MNRRLFGISGLLFAVLLVVVGCKAPLFTALYLLKGTDVEPEFEFLRKGEKRVAVVARSLVSNQYGIQNVPRDLTKHLCIILTTNCQNKKLKVVEASRIEEWLDNCDNNFNSFLEVGQDKKINADLVIGIDILGFQVRDPHSPHLMQGRCQVQVKIQDCKTGETLGRKDLTVVDPPSMPIPAGASSEVVFKPQFVKVVAEQIGFLFCPHDPNRKNRIDADNLEMHRLD